MIPAFATAIATIVASESRGTELVQVKFAEVTGPCSRLAHG